MPPETSMLCEKGILLVVDDVGIHVYLVETCEWSWVSGRSFIVICSVPVSKSLVEHKKKQNNNNTGLSLEPCGCRVPPRRTVPRSVVVAVHGGGVSHCCTCGCSHLSWW